MLFLYAYLSVLGFGLLSMPSLKYYAENKLMPEHKRGITNWHGKRWDTWWEISITGEYNVVGWLPLFFSLLLLVWPLVLPAYLSYRVGYRPLLYGLKKTHALLQLPAKLMLNEKQLSQKDPYLLEGEKEVESILKERL